MQSLPLCYLSATARGGHLPPRALEEGRPRCAGFTGDHAAGFTDIFTILSGSPEMAPLLCSPPFLMASTCSMPEITLPQTVYCRSSQGASPKQMKNWLLALCGFWLRAMEQVPRICFSLENSDLR